MASTSSSEPTSNPRGIPVFPFLPNVSDYVKSLSDVESTLNRFQEMISKYNFMQQNVERRAAGLKEKLPEMKKTLDVVRFLRKQKARTTIGTAADLSKSRTDKNLDDLSISDEESEGKGLASGDGGGELHTTFPLQDTLYAHATIKPSELDSVYLWLGANVMVAYPLDEAETLLSEKLVKAKASLKAADEDLEFIRVQVTTLEVATARVHNWDVGEKRKLREQGKDVGE